MEIATRNVIFPSSVGLAQAHPLTKPLAMGDGLPPDLVQSRATLPIRALVLVPYVIRWWCGLPQFLHNIYSEYRLYIYIYISVCISFSHFFLSHIFDYTPTIFAVPMWGSEVANSKKEIHLTNTPSEVTWAWACDVTTIEREGGFTLLGICYCVW